MGTVNSGQGPLARPASRGSSRRSALPASAVRGRSAFIK